MDGASLLLLLALSAIMAILYTRVNSYVLGTSWGTKLQGNGSFLRVTAVTTIAIFVALIVASLALGAVADRPTLPRV